MIELICSRVEYVARFRQIHGGILALEGNYQPENRVNKLFSSLVETAIDPLATHDFDDVEVRQLQIASNAAEVELERYWARRIICSFDPQAEVEEFPYIGNYRELTEMELQALQDTGRKESFDSITFVGGGLPLTAYILAKDHGLKSVILDSDPEMAALAREVVKKLGMERMMEIIYCAGEAFTEYGRLTIVAALAGVEDQVKGRILAQIPGQTTIVARTVEPETPRELLYKPLPESILNVRKVVSLVHPRQSSKYQAVINSAAILDGYHSA